jgi:hypothetical protein
MKAVMFAVLLVYPVVVLGETWRVSTVAKDWNYQIFEVEWYSNKACTSKIPNSASFVAGTPDSDGSTYGRDVWSNAFDGDETTAYDTTWEAKCGNDKCYWVGMRKIRDVKCVKVYQTQNDWVFKVERLDGRSNIWTEFASQNVRSGWTNIVLKDYTNPSITICRENQHVVNGKCQQCPNGGTNPAGDDSLDYNTVCKFSLQTCAKDFHVKDGYCQPCPPDRANKAGDRNDKGDTQCDDNILSTVFDFDVGVKLAVEGKFTSTKGTVGHPRHPRKIASAVCGNSYFVAFTSQTKTPISSGEQLNYAAEGDTYGHLAQYNVKKGSFTSLKKFRFSQCREMVDVEVSDSSKAPCSVITALCIGKYDSPRFKNFKKNLVPTTNRPMGWDSIGRRFQKTPEECNKKRATILGMYLLEWNTANGLSQEPDSVHLINTAIGNDRMGDWVIKANKDSTLLMTDLEVTVFGRCDYHEGNVNMAWTRKSDGSLTYNAGMSGKWSIGSGHTQANRLAYNSVLDNFGSLGYTDDAGWSRRFYAIGANHATPKGTVLYRNDHPGGFWPNIQSGGTSEIISFGRNGFLGSTTGALPSDTLKERSMLAIARLPGTKAQHDSALAKTGFFNETVLVWLKDLITPGYSAAWSSISHVGVGDENSNRFLLGWGEYEGEINVADPLPSGGFYLVEIDKDGKLLSKKKRIDNSGWRDKQDWLYIPATGCVVWPGAWNDINGPKGHYGSWENSPALFSTKLRISEYCPGRDTHAVLGEVVLAAAPSQFQAVLPWFIVVLTLLQLL